MTKDIEIKDIILKDIIIGKASMRVGNDEGCINKIASDIRKANLFIQPIWLCPADDPGKFMLIKGRNNFLAHKKVSKKKIKAVIFRKLTETEIEQVQSIESQQKKLSAKDLRLMKIAKV